MDTITETTTDPSPRAPRIIKALRTIGIITATISLLASPIAVITLRVLYPNKADLWDIEGIVSIIENAVYPSCIIFALSVLLIGTADRIKYHHSHKNNEHTSRKKFITTTLIASALWLLLSYVSLHVTIFLYVQLANALW